LEKEADEVGLELAAKACFDVRYIPHFWRRSDDDFPEYFSTHPSNENRSKDLENLLPKVKKKLIFN
jgi:metalloendopeptidase OMA1, mitochondrial